MFSNKSLGGVKNLYQKKKTIRVVVLVMSALIAALSIWYTNRLVEGLKERERSYINLYASTIEMAANPEGEDVTYLFTKVVAPNKSIPVILTDAYGNYVNSRNLGLEDIEDREKRQRVIDRELKKMQNAYKPIEIEMRHPKTQMYIGSQFVYYRNSFLLTQLQYYPYVQLGVISIFALIAYLVFSYSRTAEQNRVWVGMAKETAHQLGTPLSSLMAWVEYFRADPETYDVSIVQEIDKDINRLNMVTSRFSNIGSMPTLSEENLYQILRSSIGYLQSRVSTKVNLTLQSENRHIPVRINASLFEWVIENICKNAVDAMSGVGNLTIQVTQTHSEQVMIDITDTGKGIHKSKIKQVFTPGYTTKKRGWGLGLSLAQRIVENYHKGKIYVKQSEVNVGTTFRIVLPTHLASPAQPKKLRANATA
ncbi:sensor histidine kinase [Tunicatimonas pelagia]|uniref:sensor histidine kinase n=1 Tax=Tunicatimonas pelagia TaxID=931531 RepID=UPI00266510E2|nr:ATP-binding protein [Tunicatimonas pelagia]WKN40940.1 ATP-binding protein [Tunicatimonas pelagia]